MATSLTLLLVVGAVSLLVRVLRLGRRPANYPPGPPTVPILGNIHLMPTHDAHKQFQKWAEEYGPVYSLILGTKTLIVLSSAEAVKDLLDKRSAIYSDRPEMYIGQDLGSGGLRLLMMGYTPTWRSIRKLVHGLLNVTAATRYLPYQMLENRQMLYEILQKPDDIQHHIRRYANSLTTTMTFGWRTPSENDPQLRQLFHGFEEFTALAMTGTSAMLDSFPLLRRLPDVFLPTAAKARSLHKVERQLYVGHWLKAKNGLKDGTAHPSFSVDMAHFQEKEGFSDPLAGYTTGTLLEAGSGTTSDTLYAFVQAMILFPDVQRKAQKEIDSVVGDNRLPVMEDYANLSYIRGCIKESLRWMPTTILGAVPHAATQDDHYMGYLIPKGAGVMNNVWAINMNADRYPKPREFNPDRYADDAQSLFESALNPDPSKRDNLTFGAGRRICPGIHIAERSLFLGISRLLWAFHFEPALDPQTKKPIWPDPEKLTQGFDCGPIPFLTHITPRSEARAALVREEWQEAQTFLDPVTKQWNEAARREVIGM
ncbi:putative cytochrome P450 oxidoreductase [Exophiala viscosa]|uniref:Cytochrome P450 oxidoreductase n=1 Tax=Exophiala viscosa TaxID=2486360 RepID=A0AAN6II28_9EURO|nr:putative cytochrome P450 oxidoreductase [Exophiala viscosa]